MPEKLTIKEALDKTGMYTGLTMGISMRPLLHQQKDNIIVVKNKERLKKYDVALYVTPDERYVMHRVIEVHDDHYIIMGDNLLGREYVTDDMICGELIGFYKNGKHYVDCKKSKLYKFYSRLWVAIIPIKPALFKMRHIAAVIIRKVFRIKKNEE